MVRFLVDTGAEISVIPSIRADRRLTPSSSLQAADGSAINTYGLRPLALNIELAHLLVGVLHCGCNPPDTENLLIALF